MQPPSLLVGARCESLSFLNGFTYAQLEELNYWQSPSLRAWLSNSDAVSNSRITSGVRSRDSTLPALCIGFFRAVHHKLPTAPIYRLCGRRLHDKTHSRGCWKGCLKRVGKWGSSVAIISLGPDVRLGAGGCCSSVGVGTRDGVDERRWWVVVGVSNTT